MTSNNKSINPCQMKGRLGGPRNSGRHYDRGQESIVIGECECAVPMLSIAEEREPKRFCVSLRFEKDRIAVVPAPEGKKAKASDLVVVPCQATFRYQYSPGTKLYRRRTRKQGREVEFAGCQSLEGELVSAGLINYEPDLIGSKRDVLVDAMRSSKQSAKFDETFVDHLRAAPPEVLAGTISPDIFLQVVEIEVTREADGKRVAKRKRVKAFLRTLTPAQREVIDAVYLKNDKRRLKKDIAASLGISVETLRDRLDQAIKKLMTHFSEHQRNRKKSNVSPQDLIVGGYYRKSLCTWTNPSKPTPSSTIEISKNGGRDWTFKYRLDRLFQGIGREVVEPTKNNSRKFGPKTELVEFFSKNSQVFDDDV